MYILFGQSKNSFYRVFGIHFKGIQEVLAFYRTDKKSAPIIDLFKNSSVLDLYGYFCTLLVQQLGAQERLKKILYPDHR